MYSNLYTPTYSYIPSEEVEIRLTKELLSVATTVALVVPAATCELSAATCS